MLVFSQLPDHASLIEFFLGAPGHVQEQLLAREIGSFLALHCCYCVAAVVIVVAAVTGVPFVAEAIVVVAVVVDVAIVVVFLLFFLVVIPSQINR